MSERAPHQRRCGACSRSCRSECTADERRDTDNNVIGFADSCTGAEYGVDGACLDERCYIGLMYFDVRVENDRILAAVGPGAQKPGIARKDVLG